MNGPMPLPFVNRRPAFRARLLGLYSLLVWAMVSAMISYTMRRKASSAELQQYGTRTFPGRSGAEVVKAMDSALRTLGHEVTVANAATGKLKTAPKVLVVGAVRMGTYAQAYEHSLAWSFDVTNEADGATMRAIPRAFSGGVEINDNFDAQFMENAIDTIYREASSELETGNTHEPEASKTTARKKR